MGWYAVDTCSVFLCSGYQKTNKSFLTQVVEDWPWFVALDQTRKRFVTYKSSVSTVHGLTNESDKVLSIIMSSNNLIARSQKLKLATLTSYLNFLPRHNTDLSLFAC